MASPASFEARLSGGHPNSLGNTVSVAQDVIADRSLLPALIASYASDDEVVRLRVSSALKRVAWAEPEWVHHEVDAVIDWVVTLQQPSAQWTIAEILLALGPMLSSVQRSRATDVMKSHLSTSGDWIVLIKTMETLVEWAKTDLELRAWLPERLEELGRDSRKSVAQKALRLHQTLSRQ
jgi:hypothetical protein